LVVVEEIVQLIKHQSIGWVFGFSQIIASKSMLD
jgi:hypothetical protein